MAYGGEGKAALHISGRDNVTAAWVGQTLAALEYTYNLSAVSDLHDQGYSLDLTALLRLLRQAEVTSVESLNVALRAFVYEDAQLRVDLIQAGGSWSIVVDGISRVLEIIAGAFDPLVRQQRREQLRHAKVMNALAEEAEATRVAEQRMQFVFRVLQDPQSNYNLRAASELLPDQHKELNGLLMSQIGRALAILDRDEVKAIPPPVLD